MRKEYPWKCIAAPVLKSHEHGQFEVNFYFKEQLKISFHLTILTLHIMAAADS